MDVTKELDAFRKDTAGCDVVLLTDTSTQMVLSSSSATSMPQEELDRLAALAGEVMEGPLPDAALHNGETETPDEAMLGILAGADDLRLFLRAGPERPEVMVCLCSPAADLNALSESGRNVLQAIMADA